MLSVGMPRGPASACAEEASPFESDREGFICRRANPLTRKVGHHFGSSVVTRRHDETRLQVRRLEAKVERLLAHARLETSDDLTGVHGALADGDDIRAVKAYREATGVDLISAKRSVERMQRGESPH